MSPTCAFLPQFMVPAAAPILQALALSAIFVGVAALSDAAYVLVASALAPALRKGSSAWAVTALQWSTLRLAFTRRYHVAGAPGNDRKGLVQTIPCLSNPPRPKEVRVSHGAGARATPAHDVRGTL